MFFKTIIIIIITIISIWARKIFGEQPNFKSSLSLGNKIFEKYYTSGWWPAWKIWNRICMLIYCSFLIMMTFVIDLKLLYICCPINWLHSSYEGVNFSITYKVGAEREVIYILHNEMCDILKPYPHCNEKQYLSFNIDWQNFAISPSLLIK